MEKNNEELMKQYGISVEETKTYLYNGYKYDKLENAIDYAKIDKEKKDNSHLQS
jgi:hypothetical protein